MKNNKTSLKDSKQNWLAEEIERESRISVWKHYDRASDIEARHAQHCAAERIKQAHHNNCEAEKVSFNSNITKNLYHSSQIKNASISSNKNVKKNNGSIADIIAVFITFLIVFFIFTFMMNFF